MELKKHVDTLIIMSGIISSFLWMNMKFNELSKELTVIKTVLIVKGIMSESFAKESGK